MMWKNNFVTQLQFIQEGMLSAYKPKNHGTDGQGKMSYWEKIRERNSYWLVYLLHPDHTCTVHKGAHEMVNLTLDPLPRCCDYFKLVGSSPARLYKRLNTEILRGNEEWKQWFKERMSDKHIGWHTHGELRETPEPVNDNWPVLWCPVCDVAVVERPAVLKRPAASGQAGQHESVSLQHHLPPQSTALQVRSHLW